MLILLALLTAYLVWYLGYALVYSWLLIASAGGGAPPYPLLRRMFPGMAASAETLWFPRSRRLGRSVEAGFRRSWALGFTFVALLVLVPLTCMAALWWWLLAG